MNKNLWYRLIFFFEIFQKTSLISVFFLFFNACQDEFTNESDVESISVSISFDRFDLNFYDQPSEVIPELKKKYPFLFPKQFSDSVWINRQKDSLQLLLQSEVNKTFKNIELFERDVNHLFKHIKYLFPFAKIPRVITLTNNVDYQIKKIN